MKHLLLILSLISFVLTPRGLTQAITTQGTEFWLGFMSNAPGLPNSSTDRLQLFISSEQSTSGVVEVPGASWSQNFSVIPGVTTVVTIPNNIAEVNANALVENKGVHVTSDENISVFAINFSIATADGSKILPVRSLGNEYLVASYPGFINTGIEYGKSEFMIVATEDDTELEINLSAPAIGLDDDDPIIIQLDRGQTYQVIAETGQDLTGTNIKATVQSGLCRPFAVFSGSTMSSVPVLNDAADHLYEQNLPINQWSTEYYMTPFQKLDVNGNIVLDRYTYRIMARDNNTVVTLNGASVVNLDSGEFIEFNNVDIAVFVQSNLPIAISQFIQSIDGVSTSNTGDPSMLLLDGANQKISSIAFSTVESTIITQHYVNVVVKSEDVGNVLMDGTLLSSSIFQPFTGSSTHRWAAIAISEGSHHLSAPQGFNAYVYGTGYAESYAYSVGSSMEEAEHEFDGVYCSDNTVTINIGSEYLNPQWYHINDLATPIFTGNTFTLNAPIETSIYQVNAVESVSNCPVELQYSVESLIPPVFSVTPGDTTICGYQDVQFQVETASANASYNFFWAPSSSLSNSTIANPIATPYSTTTYNVTVSTPTGCASSSQSVTVTVLDGSVSRLSVTASDASICEGNTTQLTALAQEVVWSDNFDPGISWGDWNGILGGNSSTICGAASGTALYFNGSGERSATTKPIDVSNGGTLYFSLKIANGTAPCDNADPGDDVVLRYSFDGINFPVGNTIAQFNEASYPDFTNIEIEIPVAAQSTGTYFKWMQVGAWTSNQDNWVLDEMYLGANSTSTLNYSWTPSSSLDVVNISNPLATPPHTTMYHVAVTDQLTGCIYTDSLEINVDGVFDVLVESPIVKCSPGVITLEGTPSVPGAYSYSWSASDGSITNLQMQSPVVNPQSDVTFTVTLTSPTGCTQESELDVLVSALQSVELSSNDEQLCEGENASLVAEIVASNNNYTVEWLSLEPFSNGSNASNILATPTQTAWYEVIVEDDNSGCIKADSIEIEVGNIGEIVMPQTEISECVLQNYALNASITGTDQVNWQWSPASWVTNPNTANTTLNSNNNGTLTVTVTNNFGCSKSESIILETQVPELNLGPDQTLCEGQSITLFTAQPTEFDFLWNTGATTPTLVVTTSGTYNVQVLASNGCEYGDEVTITFEPVPTVDLGEDRSFCEGESAEIIAGTNTSLAYEWSNGEDTPMITVTEGGVYSVIVSNGLCNATDQVLVFMNPLPEDPFRPYQVEACFQIPPYAIELDAKNEGSIYSWEQGGSGQVLLASAPGLYTVNITTPFGCEASYSTFVEERCPGYIYIPNAFTPDNDGLNDVWLIEGVNIRTFKLELWNRWGEQIFTSDSLRKPWLGQRKDGEEYVEPGVYVYKIIYTIDDPSQTINPEYEIMGNVTLIR